MKKKFDAVQFQRKIREELSKKYTANRKAFLQELKKYSHSQRQKVSSHVRTVG
jgi:hypothetical protein